MALIPAVGRKSFKNRSVIAMVYLSLILMGICMVVPFLITVTGSACNDFDYDRYHPLPRYLWSQRDRVVRALVPYFNTYRGWSQQLACQVPGVPEHWSSWSLAGRDIARVDQLGDALLEHARRNPEKLRRRAADYAEFAGNYPLADTAVYASQIDTVNFLRNYYTAQFQRNNPELDLSGRALRQAALRELNRAWGVPYESFFSVKFTREMNCPMDFQGYFPPLGDARFEGYLKFKEAVAQHQFTPGIESKFRDFLEDQKFPASPGTELFPVTADSPEPLRRQWDAFKREHAPASPAVPFAMRAVWYSFLSSEQVALDLGLPNGRRFEVADYNRLAGTDYRTLQETPFPVPDSFDEPIRKLWQEFLQERYPLRLASVRVTPELERKYRDYLKEGLKTLKIANSLLGTDCRSWEDFRLPATPPEGGSNEAKNRRDLWKNFVRMQPVEVKQFTSSEQAFQKLALAKYGSLAGINAAYGWDRKHIEEVFPPFIDAYLVTFLENETALAVGPVWSNYRIVFDYLCFNGNAVGVTALLIALTLIFTLTINPLAAYALSRFNLRGQDKIILFMLATMAFPTMVSAIPAYLLMRDLGMLNTLWALVLPGAANGMSIFILKGFFDSLPMELFEAATIDGANEFQIFRIVAMPLVKPILAINCLNAFIIAYNGWEWAMIICQDKEMWTIAVWLYQASIWWVNSPWIVSAGFIIASIPSLVVFLACQKIILRGIVIPTMK